MSPDAGQARFSHEVQAIAALPLEERMRRAQQVRDARTGTRITYSPKVFIPLTMLCGDKCGYCTFAQPPARLDAPYLSAEQVLAIARPAQQVGLFIRRGRQGPHGPRGQIQNG